jgi:hypothetical protein
MCRYAFMYQCLSVHIFLRFLIFCFSLQVHLSLILLSHLCIFVLCFCCTLCSASYFDSMNYTSSVYFSSCPQHVISPCVIPLHSSLLLFFVMCIYTICAPSSFSMHSAPACSSPCHSSAHRVVHCHSTFSLLHSLKNQKENYILLLSIPHPLLISEFYLTLRIFLVSHSAYYNFPFFTVQLIFHSEQPTMHSHCVFILYTTTTSVTPQNPRTTTLKQLKRQPSKNHDLVMLTES